MSNHYHENLRLDKDMREEGMASYAAAQSNVIENDRMSDISSESFSSKRNEDDIEEHNDDELSGSSLEEEEVNEEVVPSGASFLIGDRALLAPSSALSRASSGQDASSYQHEPIASRFLRSNNTWAHKDHRNSMASWGSGKPGHAQGQSSHYRHNLGRLDQRGNSTGQRRNRSHSGSSFSPLSYADDNSEQLRSLEQLQNEALGSWLRLRPRDGPQAHSCLPFFTGQSAFEQRGDSNMCYPRYPITMVTESMGESRFLNHQNSYGHISAQDEPEPLQPVPSSHGGSQSQSQAQSQSQNTMSQNNNSINNISSKIDDETGEGALDDTLHQNNIIANLQEPKPNNEPGGNENEIGEQVHTISIPMKGRESSEDESKEELLVPDEHFENKSLERNGSKDPSERQSSNGKNIHWASPDSKYERYICRVDRHQDDRAQEITLFNATRPHMRAFHFAWFSFFVAFFVWFAISPLLAEIRDSLELTHEQIWTSNTYSSAGTIFFRLLAGPLCDTYGARSIMALCLVLGSLPVMAIGLVHNGTELYIVRLLSGISGASFVICQYWTSSMFVREIAGTANSLASGWGNLGGGVAQIVMGSVLFPLFKLIYGPDNSDSAWRSMFIAPAIGGIVTAVCIMKYSDDTPKGNYRKLSRLGIAPKAKIMKSFRLASVNLNTWLLFVQYACCFGVEVTMTTGAALYFVDEFDQSTEAAAALASIFGWLNLFARGLGGFISDIMNVKMNMRGRLLWQMVSLVFEGAFIICFGYAKTLGASIGTMVAFSLFVQTSEGSTYSIVPYVCPRATGSVAGIVGAGGNVGGVIYLFMISKMDYDKGFVYMGWSVICSAFLCLVINIRGYSRGLRRMGESEMSGQVSTNNNNDDENSIVVVFGENDGVRKHDENDEEAGGDDKRVVNDNHGDNTGSTTCVCKELNRENET